MGSPLIAILSHLFCKNDPFEAKQNKTVWIKTCHSRHLFSYNTPSVQIC